jgi:toxin ParE1/3/4
VRYRFAPAARQEFIDAVQWYLVEAGSTIAEHFDWAVDRALRLLVAMPNLGTRSYPGVRVWALKDFPYSVVYRVDANEIVVIAIAHQSRAPAYWRGRH